MTFLDCYWPLFIQIQSSLQEKWVVRDCQGEIMHQHAAAYKHSKTEHFREIWSVNCARQMVWFQESVRNQEWWLQKKVWEFHFTVCFSKNLSWCCDWWLGAAGLEMLQPSIIPLPQSNLSGLKTENIFCLHHSYAIIMWEVLSRQIPYEGRWRI